jgi:hypothetical protein
MISVATAYSRYYIFLAYLCLETRAAESAAWMDMGWTVSVPFMVGLLLFTGTSTLILGPTQISIQWVPWALARSKFVVMCSQLFIRVCACY